MTTNYQIEELIRDTLSGSSSLQVYIPMNNIYTAHISDVKEPVFPCITMHMFEGRYLAHDTEDFSFDRIELEVTTDKIGGAKKQLDEIYNLIQGLLYNQQIGNANYKLICFGDGKPMTITYWNEKKNRTLSKKTISYHLVSMKQ